MISCPWKTLVIGGIIAPMSVATAPCPVKTGDHVYLIDGSTYIFRAYYALPALKEKAKILDRKTIIERVKQKLLEIVGTFDDR